MMDRATLIHKDLLGIMYMENKILGLTIDKTVIMRKIHGKQYKIHSNTGQTMIKEACMTQQILGHTNKQTTLQNHETRKQTDKH